jgi:hypothetical protein
MDMDGDDKHETDDAEMTDGQETGDLIASGSGRRVRQKSHAIMPPLVPDSEDVKTVIKPIGDV